jgi:DNA replication and repair protein RecF
LDGWRNCSGVDLDTDARFVVLSGENAQGKTNILEAVHVLATLKSFREPRIRRWIQIGAQGARIRGKVASVHRDCTLEWSWRDRQRQLSIDGSTVSDLQDWFTKMSAVVFCPEDIAIVRGEPARRRQFIDRAAFTFRPTHLNIAMDYRRVLRHKAALLRQPPVDPMQLDTFDEQLARLGARLIHLRRAAVDALRGPFSDMVRDIAGHPDVGLLLKSSGVNDNSGDEAHICASLQAAIAHRRSDELDRRMVLIGPHRDELEISVKGQSARHFASQGQARTLVLALKLAQWAAAGRDQDPPLFLLDDLNSELDATRRERLVDLLRTLPGQVWVTTTDPGFLDRLPADAVRCFGLQGGGAERVSVSAVEAP